LRDRGDAVLHFNDEMGASFSLSSSADLNSETKAKAGRARSAVAFLNDDELLDEDEDEDEEFGCGVDVLKLLVNDFSGALLVVVKSVEEEPLITLAALIEELFRILCVVGWDNKVETLRCGNIFLCVVCCSCVYCV